MKRNVAVNFRGGATNNAPKNITSRETKRIAMTVVSL